MPFDGINRETVAGKMRAILGPNGERWCKDLLHHSGRYCLLGAMHKALGNPNIEERVLTSPLVWRHNEDPGYYVRAIHTARLLEIACGGNPPHTVNDAARDFSEITRVLDRFEELELSEVHAT